MSAAPQVSQAFNLKWTERHFDSVSFVVAEALGSVCVQSGSAAQTHMQVFTRSANDRCGFPNRNDFLSAADLVAAEPLKRAAGEL